MDPALPEPCSVCRRVRPEVMSLYPSEAQICPACAGVLRDALRKRPGFVDRVWPERTGWTFESALQTLRKQGIEDGPSHADLAWECLEAGLVEEAFDEASVAVTFFREPAALAEAIAVMVDPRVAPPDVLDRLRTVLYPG